MVGTMEFSIDIGDTVKTAASNGGKARREWTAEQFVSYLADQYASFPKMEFLYSEEFDGKKVNGGGYFLTIVRHSKSRGQTFIVKKGQS